MSFCSLNNKSALVKNGSWALPEVKGCGSGVYLYYPGMCQHDHTNRYNSPEEINYAALVSKKYNQPVFTVWANCGTNPSIESFIQNYENFLMKLQGKRPSFNSCCITGISKNAYKGTGFSKGHMVAMADMKMLKCGTGNCSGGTFTTCNMSPQNEKLNGERWAKLESGSRDCVTKNRCVVVYTGPLFGNKKNYCMNTNVCSGNNCSTFLSPSPEHKDWYGNNQYYTYCNQTSNNDVVVPYAYYKVVIIRDNNTKNVSTYPIIMSQETPSNIVDNASILATGKDAWDILSKEMSFLTFPSQVVNNIKVTNKDNWLQGKCPHQLPSKSSPKSRKTLYILLGVTVGIGLLLLIALIFYLRSP